jgi:hypothetical protein
MRTSSSPSGRAAQGPAAVDQYAALPGAARVVIHTPDPAGPKVAVIERFACMAVQAKLSGIEHQPAARVLYRTVES